MKLIRNIGIFFLQSSSTKWLLLEAFFYLALARILKAMPFSKIAPSLGDSMQETSYEHNTCQMKDVKNISNAIHIMSRYTFWESKCLVKGIAGMKMLRRRDIESTLYLGTARDEEGSMIAHAWLRSGSLYVSGSEGMERFTVVGKFASRVGNKEVKGDRDGQRLST